MLLSLVTVRSDRRGGMALGSVIYPSENGITS